MKMKYTWALAICVYVCDLVDNLTYPVVKTMEINLV